MQILDQHFLPFQKIEYYQKNRNALDSLRGSILEDKAIRKIFNEEITVKEKSYSKEKLEALLEKENKE